MVEGVGHVVRRVEAGQNRVGAFDQDAGTAGIDGLVGDADHVADGRQIGLIHRLVGLGLAQHADVLVVFEDGVPGIDDPGDRRLGALGLADVASLACQPEHVVLAADLACDVNARFERSMAYLRSAGLFEVNAPSIVRGSSQSRGATISTKSPSPSRIFLTSAMPFLVLGQSRSAGTMSSS